ncbi:MAG: hypothetical protein IPH59_12085 [bacterium]|nr:hypothetical protein [bacterium]
MRKSIPANPKPLLVFVHPGSLCGSYQTAHDWHPNWHRYAETRRAQICTEFAFLDAHKVVVLGSELDDEIPQYPAVQNAVLRAERTYRAGPLDEELRKTARRIWREHSHKSLSVRVTGAWADREDGCAWIVYRELRRLGGGQVILSPLAARFDVPEFEIQTGAVHPVESVPIKSAGVSRDSAALAHNERLLREHIRTNPAWRELGDRLKLIGGTAVCAAFEEDMNLVLRAGVTWAPIQKDILLIRGENCRCHQNVLRLWEANPDLKACTGYALSKDGIWRSHSWCFDQSIHRIVETTGKRVAYHGAVLKRRQVLRRLLEL